jgi:hypothetical protein
MSGGRLRKEAADKLVEPYWGKAVTARDLAAIALCNHRVHPRRVLKILPDIVGCAAPQRMATGRVHPSSSVCDTSVPSSSLLSTGRQVDAIGRQMVDCLCAPISPRSGPSLPSQFAAHRRKGGGIRTQVLWPEKIRGVSLCMQETCMTVDQLFDWSLLA